jgi:hypothetical protein
MVWVRTDGQRITGDPVLTQQVQVDLTICQGELQRANLSGVTVSGGGMAGIAAAIERGEAAKQVGQGCMAQKGYAHVSGTECGSDTRELCIRRSREKAPRGIAAVGGREAEG